jgi:putative iron-dependent peroxidase
VAQRQAPQDVLAPPAQAAVFLVLTVRSGAERVVADLLADVPALTRSVGFRYPEELLAGVVGIGAELWDRLYHLPRPAGLHPFREFIGDKHRAVATPGDLLLHARARRADLCFELVRQIMDRLTGGVDVADEVQAFRYFDNRDLLGFVDGTENPTGQAARDAVFVGAQDPAYAGGSYAIVQKYLHDLPAWQAIGVAEQERVIGRTKLDDIEMPDEVKPANSHVALNTITDPDGTERDILRANLAFGSERTGEFGTYFIGYAADPAVTERMLENMFVGDPPGNYDRILDFSTAVTGGLFFVPSADFLEDQAGAGPAGRASDDGSLGIGSLKDR